MWESSSLPWARVQYLEIQKEKLKKLLIPVSGITVLVILDYFYIQPTPDSFISERILALVSTACIVGTTFGVYKYLQYDFESHKLKSNDIITEQKRRNIEKSKELLKKAGVQSAQKVIRTNINLYENYSPVHQTYENVSPVIPQPLKLNIRPFDYTDNIAEEFMKSKGLDKKIKSWMQNIRLWYSKEFLPLILENYTSNLNRLNSLLREHTRNKERPWIYSGTFEDEGLSVSYEETMYYQRVSLRDIQDLAIEIGCNYAKDIEITRSFSFRGQNPTENQQALQRVAFIDILKQRIIFEKYIDVPGYNCRGYVIQRMRALARTSCLNGYSSSSGGFYLADSWTPKRPTDSHILSHLFFCLLNNGNNPNSNIDSNIMSDIIINYPSPLPNEDQPHKVWFYQKNPDSQIEPHFDVISGKEIWQAYKGNDNLFCAIALFLHHVKNKSQGYFLHMNCAELLELIP